MNIDQEKLQKLLEAASWIEQARKHYAAWMWQLGDDCVKRARNAINDPIFDRKPIFESSREIPATVKVKAPHLPQGFMIVNGTDFDGETMELHVEPSPVNTKRSK